jgi:hypothetical protein
MTLLVIFLIYFVGLILTAIIIRIINPKPSTSVEYMCGTFVEWKNDNYEIAVLWPAFLVSFIFLSPLIISKYIIDYCKNNKN